MMAALAYRHPAPLTSRVLSDSVNADPGFVRRTLSKLVKAGLVHTTKGPQGSCSLAKPAQKINLWDIYLAAEPPACFAIHSYPDQEACPVSLCIKPSLENVLESVRESVEKVLKRTSLKEIVETM